MADRRVLIVDDEPVLVRLLEYVLDQEGYEVQVAYSGKAAREAIDEGFDGVVLLDLKLPDMDGLDLVEPILAENPANRILILTAHGSIDTAVEATKRGAYDFLTKADDLTSRVTLLVRNAFRDRGMAWRVSNLEEAVTGQEAFRDIIARSPEMHRTFDTLRHALDSRVTVLIQGDSGTGKELVARALHYGGSRRGGPFVALNCAGLPDSLLESELFGHERGAFTGAVSMRKGKFEVAHGGTLFLDEIGEMSLHLQSKLLRVLETREVERIGGNQARSVDVRIISATHRDLQQMVADGTLREDLYYRLAVFSVRIPSLRERDGDVALLARHFMRKAADDEGKTINGFTPSAMRALERFPFPGNVRELENIVNRAVVVASGPQITLGDLPHQVVEAEGAEAASDDEPGEAPGPEPGMPLDEAFEQLFQHPDQLPALEDLEQAAIRRALQLHDGNMARAARALGIARATLYRRLERIQSGEQA